MERYYVSVETDMESPHAYARIVRIVDAREGKAFSVTRYAADLFRGWVPLDARKDKPWQPLGRIVAHCREVAAQLNRWDAAE